MTNAIFSAPGASENSAYGNSAPAKSANTNSAEDKRAKNDLKKREGDAAMAAYLAERRATDVKTARLRELRLAKEAADQAAAAAAPPPAKKVTRAKKKAVV